LVYLTDDRNAAILPDDNETFDGHALISVDHYKVVGTSVSVASGRIPAAAATCPATCP